MANLFYLYGKKSSFKYHFLLTSKEMNLKSEKKKKKLLMRNEKQKEIEAPLAYTFAKVFRKFLWIIYALSL